MRKRTEQETSEPVVRNLYKDTESLHSFPRFCRTSFLPNTTESKNGLHVSHGLRRAPKTVRRTLGVRSNPVKEPLLKTLYEWGKDGCYATLKFITFHGDMWNPVFPDQTIFDFPTSIFNHFHNKIVSAQRNIHSIHILYTITQTTAFQRGIFVCT